MITLRPCDLANRASYWQALPAVVSAREPEKETTKIILDVVKRTAEVTHNSKTRLFQLKAIDPYEMRRFYVGKLGYESAFVGSAILLTKTVKQEFKAA